MEIYSFYHGCDNGNLYHTISMMGLIMELFIKVIYITGLIMEIFIKLFPLWV